MKPFGVRLAAGAVTILLGAIMAAQAQKDHQNERTSAWNPTLDSSLGVPPTPIASADGQADESPEPSPFADVPDAIQLVQHTETNELPSGGFGIPEGALPTFDSSDSGPEMELPATGNEISSAIADALALPTNVAPTLKMTEEEINAAKESVPSLPVENSSPETVPAEMPAAHAFAASDLPGSDLPGSEMPANSQIDSQSQPSNMLRGMALDDLRPGPDPSQNQVATQQLMQPTGPDPVPAMTADIGSPDQGSPQQLTQHGQPGSMLRTVALPSDSTGDQYNSQWQSELPQLPRQSQPQQTVPQLRSNGSAAQFVQDDRMNQPSAGHPRYDDPAQGQNNFHQPLPAISPANNGFVQNNNNFNQPASGFAPQSGPYTAPPLQDNPYVGRPGDRTASLPNARNQNYMTPALPASHQLRGDPNASYAQPGDRRLEGAQSPSVVIHKRAPTEVKVGKPASFIIHVQNVGSAEALDVRVHDRVPSGMRLVDASPRPQTAAADGEMVWQLGSLAANEERTITMQLIPEQEGELGSVARVTFETAASVRTISTRPEIKITQRAPTQVLIGQQLEIELEVSNPGTGDATGVMMQEDVPEGLEHAQGRQLDNLIGTLRPGEVRRQMLRMRAVAPGMIQNTIHLKADDGMETNHTVNVEVVAPKLEVALTGPKRRFLERQAKFMLQIANTGTYEATNVEIAAYLDRGFTFVSTEHEGTYDPSRHAVFWEIVNLPHGVAPAQVPLTLLPVQEGNRAIRLEAKADLGVVGKSDTEVAVDSLAELTFQISDSADPIEIGGETTYEIKLTNSGSKQDSNVRVQLQFPPGVELLGSDSEVQTDGRGLVAFRPKAQLAANTDVVYRVKARGLQAGTHLIKAVVTSDQSQVPVTKEESTMVYADR